MTFCNLNDLEGGPEEVDDTYVCSANKLKSLKGSPIKVGSFVCRSNSLKTLEGGPKEVSHWYDCSENQLISLKGSPKIVRVFKSAYNKNLNSLKDGPEIIIDALDIFGNRITDMENVPVLLLGDLKKLSYIKYNDTRVSGLWSGIPINLMDDFVDSLNRKIDEFVKNHPEYTIDTDVRESLFPKFDDLSKKLLRKVRP